MEDKPPNAQLVAMRGISSHEKPRGSFSILIEMEREHARQENTKVYTHYNMIYPASYTLTNDGRRALFDARLIQ